MNSVTRKNYLAVIHILKKDNKIGDAVYRDVILDISKGKTNSSAKLNEKELKVLIKRLKGENTPVKPKRDKEASKGKFTQADKIRAIWSDMHTKGVVETWDYSALRAFIKKHHKIDHENWLNAAQATDIINRLESWREAHLSKITKSG